MGIAWSFSAMGLFETCPYRYYILRVTKQIKEPEGEEARWGKIVHKHFENAIKDGTALPETLANWQSTVDTIMAAPGQKFAEKQYCINDKFEPVSWFAKDAWVRAVVDVEIRNADAVFAGDWKTGKKKPGSDQLELTAGIIFASEPDIAKVQTGFFWMKEKLPLEKFTHVREQSTAIWQKWLPRVQRLEEAFARDRWPKRPSGLCRAWCPVGKKLCEHCGKD